MNTLPIRIQPELGHIDAHARLLVTIANATGREVREVFNGADLVARPGDTHEGVITAWEEGRKFTPEQLQELRDMTARLRAERDNLPHGV